jgi:NTE family protein
MSTIRPSKAGKKATHPATPATIHDERPRRAPASTTSPAPLKKKLDVVMEGGGVKGIALVGAAQALEDEFTKRGDWEYGKFIGTSAGSVVAALLAAGYTAKELSEIVAGPEIAQFADQTGIAGIPAVGKFLDMGLGILTRLGMFKGDYFLGFLRDKLLARGIRTFRDLVVPGYEDEKTDMINKYRLHMIASDVTRGRMLILPDDVNVEHHGVRPDDLEVALAVRMSISVPFVFEPVQLHGLNGVTSYVVDGGLLSNFPVQAFDRAPYPTEIEASPEQRSRRRAWEAMGTIGIKLLGNRYNKIAYPLKALRAVYALVSTALEAHDTTAARKFDLLKSNRTVNINTDAVSILRFSLSPLEREVLYTQGYDAMNGELRAGFLSRAEEAAQASKEANSRLDPALQR